MSTVCAELEVNCEMLLEVKSTPAPGVLETAVLSVRVVPVALRVLAAAAGPEIVRTPVVEFTEAVIDAAV